MCVCMYIHKYIRSNRGRQRRRTRHPWSRRWASFSGRAARCPNQISFLESFDFSRFLIQRIKIYYTNSLLLLV